MTFLPADPSGLSALAGGAAKLLGGLFGGRGPSETEQVIARVKGAVMGGQKFGIHPLEILRSGSASGTTPRGGRVGTAASMVSQGFDQIEQVLSGRQAREDEALRLDNELRRIQIDRERSGFSTRTGSGPFTRLGRAGVPDESSGLRPRQEVIGSPVSVGDTDDAPVTVTNPNSDGGEFVDPTVKDIEAAEARSGDGGEIVEMFRWASQQLRDWDYNKSLQFVAPRMNMSVEELHRRVVEDPSIRDALPGPIARTVIEANEIFRHFRPYEGGGVAVPRPPRMALPSGPGPNSAEDIRRYIDR